MIVYKIKCLTNGAISDAPAHIWADKDPKEFEVLSKREVFTKAEIVEMKAEKQRKKEEAKKKKENAKKK